MNPTRLNDDLAVALAWLTRLPARFPARAGKRTLAQAAWAFPLVGLIVGAGGAFVGLVAAEMGAPTLLGAVLMVSAMILITGGLHEDGLADFLDGLGARGDRQAKLAAMRDSSIGAYGVLALLISFSVKVAAVASLPDPFALILICALSRAAMVGVMAGYAPARTDGAASKAGRPEGQVVRQAWGIAVASILVLWLFVPLGPGFVILVPLLGFAVARFVAEKAERVLGGMTGDVLGAVCLTSETAMLVLAAMILSPY